MLGLTTVLTHPDRDLDGPPGLGETSSAGPPLPRVDRSRALRRASRGRAEDPAWVRPSLAGLLMSTAVLYLWGLGASGWANSYYSAAVQAGSQSWKAFLFGSLDASNAITVDKAPAFLWPMEISARIFGVNAWSMLVPEALMGLATVGLVYLTVRRWFNPAAGLIAGAVVALTPVATLMFRFNNPDALLVLLLTAAAYATTRAIEKAETRWVLAVGALVGAAFLAKMLQAFLVVPGFGLAYIVAAPTHRRRRAGQLLMAAAAALVSGGWWVALAELWPAGSRPYIGGSQNNSVLNLIFGYNGFGRLSGNETGSVGGGVGPTGTGQWGATGWSRMFNDAFGGQASWLLPAAFILLAALLLLTWRSVRTDRTRAAMIIWGGWLVVTAAAFSFGKGIIHEYYTVALAPAIGAIVGMGVCWLWARRARGGPRVLLSVALGATAVWAAVLLGRTPDWNPALRPFVLVAGLAGAALLLAEPLLPRARRTAMVTVAALGLAAALIGPGAYSIATAQQVHSGALPTAGPVGASRSGFGGRGFGGRGGPGFGGRFSLPQTATAGTQRGFGLPFPAGAPTGGAFPGSAGQAGSVRGGGIGGILNGSTPSAEVTSILDANSGAYDWVAAVVSANQAAGYQLATGDPVMAIGGFNGTDPYPTLQQFEQTVAAGRIHYFIAGGGGFGGGFGAGGATSSNASSAISEWVAANFKSDTVGGVTLYDLTA